MAVFEADGLPAELGLGLEPPVKMEWSGLEPRWVVGCFGTPLPRCFLLGVTRSRRIDTGTVAFVNNPLAIQVFARGSACWGGHLE